MPGGDILGEILYANEYWDSTLNKRRWYQVQYPPN